jgi:CHAT domain-containing protein
VKVVRQLLISTVSVFTSFYFAGHAVNQNDYPEFAGLYGEDNEIVSAADILNLGIGPEAIVLSACETGVEPSIQQMALII